MQSEAIIKAAIDNDPTIRPEQREAILSALNPTPKKPKVIPITTKEAARMLEIHPVTMRRWIKEKKIKAIRYSPRRVRIDRNEVERLVAEGVV